MRLSQVIATSFLLSVAAASSSVDNVHSSDNLPDVERRNDEVNHIDISLPEDKNKAVHQKGEDYYNPTTNMSSKLYSFYVSISMIFVSEIGDKTFLIAALMAMRHPRLLVFSAASSALVLMTVLSGFIGHVLPQIVSPTFTRTAASMLFFIFGVNLLREGLMTAKDQGVEEELAEVEEEIANSELSEIADNLEKGDRKEDKKYKTCSNLKNLISYISSPVWYQTFSTTFLCEWGDRSQVTTIAMAAGSDWGMIIMGGSIGHIICTLIAVVGGRYISTKISLRTILFGGSFAFFNFSLFYGYLAMYE